MHQTQRTPVAQGISTALAEDRAASYRARRYTEDLAKVRAGTHRLRMRAGESVSLTPGYVVDRAEALAEKQARRALELSFWERMKAVRTPDGLVIQEKVTK